MAHRPPAEQRSNDWETSAVAVGLRISLPRIVLLTMLSYGLYALYWTYITWKQYRDHTGETAYPVWHALAQLVPIYGWFRFYAHVRAYENLMEEHGTRNNLRIRAVMGIVVWATLLGLVSAADDSYVSGIVSVSIDLVRILMAVAVICWVQFNINRYWAERHWSSPEGPGVRSAPIGKGAIALTCVGTMVWIYVIIVLNYLSAKG